MDNYKQLRREIIEWGLENKKQHEIIRKRLDETIELIRKMQDKPLIIEGEMTETKPPSKSVYYNNPDSEPE